MRAPLATAPSSFIRRAGSTRRWLSTRRRATAARPGTGEGFRFRLATGPPSCSSAGSSMRRTLCLSSRRLCRVLGGSMSLQLCLGNQGLILYGRGRLDEAMVCSGRRSGSVSNSARRPAFRSPGDIRVRSLRPRPARRGHGHRGGSGARLREVGDNQRVAAIVGNRALVARSQGRLDDAMRLFQEHARICRGIRDKAGLQKALGNQGSVLQIRGKNDDALALYREQEGICRELGTPDGLAICLINQAAVPGPSASSARACPRPKRHTVWRPRADSCLWLSRSGRFWRN